MSCLILNLMKQDDFVTISDVHVDSKTDPKYRLFLDFFKHPEVIDTEYIFLLGDIFDVLVGDYNEYIEEYREFFQLLNSELSRGKKIICVEGNHDFHYYDVLKKALTKENLNKIKYCKDRVEIYKENQRYYLSHGDELDFQNPKYLKYRKFMRSHAAKTIINYFIDYKHAMKLKSKMQNNSRLMQRNFQEKTSREQFRGYAEFVKSMGFQKVILGHSHIQDDFENYYNNGYFPNTQSFILDRAGSTELIKLS